MNTIKKKKLERAASKKTREGKVGKEVCAFVENFSRVNLSSPDIALEHSTPGFCYESEIQIDDFSAGGAHEWKTRREIPITGVLRTVCTIAQMYVYLPLRYAPFKADWLIVAAKMLLTEKVQKLSHTQICMTSR